MLIMRSLSCLHLAWNFGRRSSLSKKSRAAEIANCSLGRTFRHPFDTGERSVREIFWSLKILRVSYYDRSTLVSLQDRTLFYKVLQDMDSFA